MYLIARPNKLAFSEYALDGVKYTLIKGETIFSISKNKYKWQR
jgi:hypothetical protein